MVGILFKQGNEAETEQRIDSLNRIFEFVNSRDGKDNIPDLKIVLFRFVEYVSYKHHSGSATYTFVH